MCFPVNFVTFFTKQLLQNTSGATASRNSRLKSKVNIDVYNAIFPLMNLSSIREHLGFLVKHWTFKFHETTI